MITKATSTENWFDINAPLNEERKFDHGEGCREAGESPDYRSRLYVRRTNKGWEWYCHNCGKGGRRDYSGLDLAKTCIDRADVCSTQRCKDGSVSELRQNLQWPERTNFTKEAWDWLAKYGIRDYEITKYGIYYTSEYGGRIVLPLYSVYGLLPRAEGFQLRRVSGTGPKYITRLAEGVANAKWVCNVLESPTIVLVEDIVSAIKIARYRSVWAILGSPKHLPDSHCFELAQEQKGVIIWLDRDKAVTGEGYCNRLRRIYGLKTAQIITDKDPKEHSDAEIQQLLTNVENML